MSDALRIFPLEGVVELPLRVIGPFLGVSFHSLSVTLHVPLKASFLAFLITDGNSVFALDRYADLILSVLCLYRNSD